MKKVLTPKRGVRDDWWIIMNLANRLGADWNYRNPKDIFEEIRKVTPSYAGMTYKRIEKELLQWPCPAIDHPGNTISTQR